MFVIIVQAIIGLLIEYHFGPGHGIAYVGRKREPSFLNIELYELREARFVYGNFPAFQLPDLGRVIVYAYDVIAKARKTASGHKPYIARADNRYLH